MHKTALEPKTTCIPADPVKTQNHTWLHWPSTGTYFKGRIYWICIIDISYFCFSFCLARKHTVLIWYPFYYELNFKSVCFSLFHETVYISEGIYYRIQTATLRCLRPPGMWNTVCMQRLCTAQALQIKVYTMMSTRLEHSVAGIRLAFKKDIFGSYSSDVLLCYCLKECHVFGLSCILHYFAVHCSMRLSKEQEHLKCTVQLPNEWHIANEHDLYYVASELKAVNMVFVYNSK